MTTNARKEVCYFDANRVAECEHICAWSDLSPSERRAALTDQLQLLGSALSDSQFRSDWLARSGTATEVEQNAGDARPRALYQALTGAIATQGWRVAEVEPHSTAHAAFGYHDGYVDWQQRQLCVRRGDLFRMLITLLHEDAHRRLEHQPDPRSQQSERFDPLLALEVYQQIEDQECQAEAVAYLVTEYFRVDSTQAVTYLAGQISKIGQRLQSHAGPILDTALGIIDCIEPLVS